MSTPTVAIIIPSYNYADYLAVSIESALAQTRPADEIVVVDDGSTDSSAEIADRYAPRVRTIRQQNLGPSSARNTGIRETDSEFLVFLDADDALVPEGLETLLGLYETVPDTDVVFGFSAEFEQRTGAEVPHPAARMKRIESVDHDLLPGAVYRFKQSLFSELLRGSFIGMGASLIPRRVFDTVGLYDESLSVSEDRDMWLRIAPEHRFVYVHKPVLKRRLHQQNLTNARNNIKRNQTSIAIGNRIRTSLPGLKAEDGRFLRRSVSEAARECARHFISEGEGVEARKYVAEYREWSRKTFEPAVLYGLSLLPGRLLRWVNRGRKRLRRDDS